MADYSTYMLPNGLQMIYQFVPSKVSYAGFTVHAGSRDEGKGEDGLAHFVEHLLSRGPGGANRGTFSLAWRRWAVS